jgi:hypothetical protein
MEKGFIFGSFVNILDANKNERVNIGIITCKDLLLVLVHGSYGVENSIVVLIEVVNEDYE